MSFGEAIKSVFSKYATFSGRARRSEYWYFVLFNFLVSFVLGIIEGAASIKYLTQAYSLAVFIPGLAVTVRRLHDIGKSGWAYLWFIIPCLVFGVLSVVIVFNYYGGIPTLDQLQTFQEASDVNIGAGLSLAYVVSSLLTGITAIIMLVWMFRDSQPGTNQYGPNPKEQPNNTPNTME